MDDNQNQNQQNSSQAPNVVNPVSSAADLSVGSGVQPPVVEVPKQEPESKEDKILAKLSAIEEKLSQIALKLGA